MPLPEYLYGIATEPFKLHRGMNILARRGRSSYGSSQFGTTLSHRSSRSSCGVYRRWTHFFLKMDTLCRLYRQQEGSILFLFFACVFTADIWKRIRDWARLRKDMLTNRSSLKCLLKENRGTSWRCTQRKLSFAATLYYLWEYRNRVIFQFQEPNRDYIVCKIKIQVYKIIYALYPHILI